MTAIQENYNAVLERIQRAAHRSGREGDQIRLVVVTKTHPVEAIREVIQAGARDLGENYAEAALPKIEALKGEGDLNWHMIGHIQSRKAKFVCGGFHYVHSVDRLKVANALERFCGEQNRDIPVLLECNVSGEESKFGWPAWEEENWEQLMEPFARLLELPHLHVQGLMTMAPFFDQPEQARPFFKKLKRLADFLRKKLPQVYWDELSMGMSGDFEAAIEEGATIVRIGTAVMGSRSR
jgi:PLP dependent protein